MGHFFSDQLQNFEFHDSCFSYISWNDEVLKISVKHLNAKKDTLANDFDSDMEIEEAKITFCGFSVKEFEPLRAWHRNEDGDLYTDDPHIIYTDIEARNMFEDELRNSFAVTGIFNNGNEEYELSASSGGGGFTLRFRFSSVAVEWEKYLQKAWYELHKQYKKELTLATPNGDVKKEIIIIFNDESILDADTPAVSISLFYEGNYILGKGEDFLGTDAFANLQKNLPQGVSLKCCLNCKHGNMCPVGNVPFELFCTQDVKISQKSDLYFYTEDFQERVKRLRNYTDICEKYCEPTSEDYVYTDYLFYLK